MNINFYVNTSDNDTLNKNLTASATVSGYLKEPCSVENPVITLQNTGRVSANYCYIPAFGRYYYIVDQTILSNNRCRIECKVDVLQTFRTQISALSAIIDMSTSNHDDYLASERWIASTKHKTDILNFPSGLNNEGQYILITAGG